MQPTDAGNETPSMTGGQRLQLNRTDTVLLEREAELAAIQHEIAASADGSGRLIIVEGPSGIGKSSLLTAADAIARDMGAQVLTTSGGELERAFPFGLVRRLLEQRVARAEPDERKALFRGHAGLVESLLQPATFASGPSQWFGVYLTAGSLITLAATAALRETATADTLRGESVTHGSAQEEPKDRAEPR